jgi:hypothetical protein
LGENRIALPDAIDQLAKRTSVRPVQIIEYKFDANLGRQLLALIPPGPRLLPDGLSTPFGSAEQIATVLHSLNAICAYHLLSVFLGSVDRGVATLCQPRALLMIPRAELGRRLAQISGYPEQGIAGLLRLLTYDHKLRSLDPALQPLVPAGPDILLIPPTFILSSNLQRNFLI